MKYFKEQEFMCKCCNTSKMDITFMNLLDHVRKEYYPYAMNIVSGYRCPHYNKKIGGVKDSAHTLGLAADIHCGDSRKRFKMIEALLRAGFHRMGIAKTFIHVDNDRSKPDEVIWTY